MSGTGSSSRPGTDGCIFCAAREDLDLVLVRGRVCYVILNLYPYNNGHLMVVPYRHVATLQATTLEERSELMRLARHGEMALEEAYRPDGINVGANVRAWWRSYPWMAFYPGLAFFISIMAFNLTGEGLRRFLDESRLNLSRLFNRYTLMAGMAAVIILTVILQANAPMSLYKPEGLKFDPQRVMQDIKVLSSPDLQGRETGMVGEALAAKYIAKRMEENGLMPAGEKLTYFQTLVNPRRHLLSIPTLSVVDENAAPLVYRRDFAEIAGYYALRREASDHRRRCLWPDVQR